MSNLYRGPSIDASYQVSIHLAKRFLRRRFKKIGQSETRIAKNCLWWPCLLMDRDEMSNLYRRPSIDASYQVSRQTPCDGKSSHCLWQGELKCIQIGLKTKQFSFLWLIPFRKHLLGTLGTPVSALDCLSETRGSQEPVSFTWL